MATHSATAALLVDPRLTYGEATDRILAMPMRRGFPRAWWAVFGLSLALTLLGMVSVTYLLVRGVGIWGVNNPVGWGFAIINFVWWIGIGHAGTLISAILLLLRQQWRTSINRLAEAMTLFAVANAGLFPILHLGRIAWFYYLLPYPDTMGLWPQWRSPLVWDVFAVLTYLTVSFIFWYVGLIPDFASLRDSNARLWVRRLAGIVSLGWRGSARHWHNYQMVYLLLAGLGTPLVVSVHSIVSLDFATSVLPGWHTTVFPPYFVAGAIYSGFAMVLTIAIPLRKLMRFEDLITVRHLDVMGKVMLTAGLIVAYGYLMESFTAWYSGEAAERFLLINRATGPYAVGFWGTVLCNVIVAQSLWFRRVRTRPMLLSIVAMFINLGMWLERFVIVVVSLHRDYLPSSWDMYYPTFWDVTLFIGTIGLFGALMLVFVRMLPVISIFEVRELLHAEKHGHPENAACPPGAAEEPPDYTPPQAVPQTWPIPPAGASYGVMAEFRTPEELAAAAGRARESGYRRIDAFSPFPLHNVAEALGVRRSWVPLLVLLGAIMGGMGAYVMQAYSATIDYPVNIAGRPYNSWPSFLLITFELAVLGGALFGVLGMLAMNGLPRPYHPVFNVPDFERATRDRFFLCIERRDPRFEPAAARDFLQSLGPIRVCDVPE